MASSKSTSSFSGTFCGFVFTLHQGVLASFLGTESLKMSQDLPAHEHNQIFNVMSLNNIESISILAVITVILAIYTLVGLRWWLENQVSLSRRFRGLFLIVIVALVFAPMMLLAYLMNDVHIVKNIDANGRFVVFMAWIAPGVLYNVIYLVRKDKSGK